MVLEIFFELQYGTPMHQGPYINNHKLNYWDRDIKILNFSNDYKLLYKVVVPQGEEREQDIKNLLKK